MPAPPTANSMICSKTSSGGTGAGRQPLSRYSTSVSQRQLAGFGELLVGQAALRHTEEHRVGPQVVAQQREVAGQVGERGQQRGDLGLRERRRGSRRRTR